MTDPVHLVARAGDKRALCGVKDPEPYALVRWAPGHRYPHARCPECFERAGLGALLEEDAP